MSNRQLTVVGIIYGATTGIVRRYIYTDEPWTVPNHVADGEAILYASPEDMLTTDAAGNTIPNPDAASALVAAQIGFPPEPARCVVIEDGTGNVVEVLMADPLIDSVDGHTLFQDAVGVPGSVPDETGAFQPLSGD